MTISREELINDTETSFRLMMEGNQAKLWTAMPAIIDSVDFDAMTIEAQPAIQGVITNQDGSETFLNLPLLVDCPIVFPGGGGFILTFPLVKGDEVLIIIASRCIDSWFQQGGVQPHAEFRMHDLSDGFALPGPKSQPNVVSSISASNAQLRSNDGTLYIEMTSDGKLNLITTAGLNITGDVVVTGKLSTSGDIKTSTGNITADVGNIVATLGEVEAGPLAIPLSMHIHPTTSPGSPTGPPLP